MEIIRHTFIAFCVLLFSWFSPGARAADVQEIPAGTPAAKTVNPANFTVNASLFASDVPLLVFEVENEDIVSSTISGRMLLYDKEDGDNRLADAPVLSVPVVLREMRERKKRGKFPYSIELAGGAAAVSLAGLPPDNKWLLRGSSDDKTMLRNGLAYMLGERLLPKVTPKTRFCEVLFSHSGILRYEGVYILAETGERIVREFAAPGDAGILLRYVVHREDRDDNTVRTGNKLFSAARIDSSAPLTRDDRRDIGVALEKVESVLHSVSPSAFLQYQSYLDEDSAVNFFLLNSIMLNIGEDMVPFALLRNRDNKFQFLPDWDFDLAVDNAPVRLTELPFDREREEIPEQSILARRLPVWRTLEEGGGIEDLRMYPIYQAVDGDRFLWLDRLFMSRSFLANLHKRFHACRAVYFSRQKPLGIVDMLAWRLGPAVERDWIRWGKEYAATELNGLAPFVDDEEVRHNRQTASYDQELVKISHCLKNQDDFLVEQINELRRMSGDLYDKGKSGTRQAAYSLATLVAMAIIIFILTRRI